MGDFNKIILPSEVRGGNFCRNRANIFVEVLENCNLVNLGASGYRYTWHRNHNGMRTTSKRLDRVVSDCLWRTTIPKAFMENLCCMHSDHHSILLRCGGLPSARGIRPFRFEAIWVSHQDFCKIVGDAWYKGDHGVVCGLVK